MEGCLCTAQSVQGLVKYIFVIKSIFVLDMLQSLQCKHLENIFQLNLYSVIGYILPTIGGYMSFGGFLPWHPECFLPK